MEKMPARSFTRSEPAPESDAALLKWLMAKDPRPNMLVECLQPSVGRVLGHLKTSCERPLRACTLPGTLELPATKQGTLLVENVAALTQAQQRQLFDWLSSGCDDIQVVSVTTEPLAEMVEQGDFLEPLFYRLNIVRLNMTPAGSAGQDWTRHTMPPHAIPSSLPGADARAV